MNRITKWWRVTSLYVQYKNLFRIKELTAEKTVKGMADFLLFFWLDSDEQATHDS